jgi:hypothetical protein
LAYDGAVGSLDDLQVPSDRALTKSIGRTWAEFLTGQAKRLMACDFFGIDTILFRRLSVLAFIDHGTRFVGSPP